LDVVQQKQEFIENVKRCTLKAMTSMAGYIFHAGTVEWRDALRNAVLETVGNFWDQMGTGKDEDGDEYWALQLNNGSIISIQSKPTKGILSLS